MTDTTESPRFFPGQFVNDKKPGADQIGLRIVRDLDDDNGVPMLRLGHPGGTNEWYPAMDFKVLGPGAACKNVGEEYGETQPGDHSHRYEITEIDKTCGMMKVLEIRNGTRTPHPHWIPWVASAFGGGWSHLSLIATMEGKTFEATAVRKAARELIEEKAAEEMTPAQQRAKDAAPKPEPKFRVGAVVKPSQPGNKWSPRVVLSRREAPGCVYIYLLAVGNGLTAEWSEGQLEQVAPNISDYMTDALFQQRKELDNFKAEIGAAARKAKVEHGWCSEVDDLLRDLGVPVLTEMVTAVVTITVEVDLRPDGSDALKYLGDLGWFTRSLKVSDSDDQIEVTADSDFGEEPEVRYISHAVIGVTDQSYTED